MSDAACSSMETGGITHTGLFAILHCSDWNQLLELLPVLPFVVPGVVPPQVLLDFVVYVMVAPLSASPEAGFWPIT